MTAGLAWTTSVHAAAQRDFDVREQLTEQATTAVADATTQAWALGTGDIRLESSNPKAGDLLVQRTFVDTQAAWRKQAEIIRSRLVAYLTVTPRDKTLARWNQTATDVDDLLVLGVNVRQQADRSGSILTLRKDLGSRPTAAGMQPADWQTLRNNPLRKPSEQFRTAYKRLVDAVRMHVEAQIQQIEGRHTRLWPHACAIRLFEC